MNKPKCPRCNSDCLITYFKHGSEYYQYQCRNCKYDWTDRERKREVPEEEKDGHKFSNSGDIL